MVQSRLVRPRSRSLFYNLLLLSEKPGSWRLWTLVPLGVACAAGIGWLWGRGAGNAALGWGVGLSLLALSSVDGALFVALPSRGLSFGPAQTPWLALLLVRGGLTLAAFPFAARWPHGTLAALALAQAGLMALMAWGTLVEPFRLRVTTVRIGSPKLSNPGTPLRIVHLSDLHVERLTRRERSLPLLIESLAPDLIVLTGDYLNTSYQVDPRAVADLRWLLERLHAPAGVYAIWGTPEVDLPGVLRPVWADLGIPLLEDRACAVQAGEHTLWLVGLSCTRDLEAGGAQLRALLAGAPPDAFTILLHHTPDLMPQATALGVDLVLSGHTHGGQWCLPGWGALHTSSRFGKRYEAGEIVEGNTHLIVSRGLGMEGFGTPRARLFCPPEVVAITLTGADGNA